METQEQNKKILGVITEEFTPQESTELVSWSYFLSSSPPGKELDVSGLIEPYHESRYLAKPDIQLHCDNPACQGILFFDHQEGGCSISTSEWNNGVLSYRCKNCEETYKDFAIRVILADDLKNGKAIKLGEWPLFGPVIPRKVITLIEPDKEEFRMGLRAENQGMGVGAFAYYRRVVENQKNRIFDEIIKVAKKIKAPNDVIENLEQARNATRFSDSVESLKDVLPPVLLIDGHINPLKLLHKALSAGLHAKTDDECLKLATNIRVVLTDLADRLNQALKKQKDLNDAVKSLSQ